MSSGSIVVDCLSVMSLLDDVGAEMKLEIHMVRPNFSGLIEIRIGYDIVMGSDLFAKV